MSEDCLSLNVTAPAGAASEPRPVMVFIHGGAYLFGSSAVPLYSGHRLVQRGDVVYVSFNYRLGAFGFLDFSSLSTSDHAFESNLGLRDQIAALRWVRDNIAAFGGDPGNVTIFGESAGASSVVTLLTTPSSAGLFHRAIAQSATPASVYGPKRSAGWAEEFVAVLGGVDRLVTGSMAELVSASSRFARPAIAALPGGTPFAPVVDGDVIPDYPLDVLNAGMSEPVPLIIGTNDREGALFYLMADMLPSRRAAIERMFEQTDPDAMTRVITEYPGKALRDLGGDAVFWYPSVLAAEGHSQRASAYSYRYDFAPRLLRVVGADATHGTEMYAVFNDPRLALAKAMGAFGDRSAMRAVYRRVQDNWLHFARYGRPADYWPCYEPNTRLTMIIDAVNRLEPDPRSRRRIAWTGYRSYR